MTGTLVGGDESGSPILAVDSLNGERILQDGGATSTPESTTDAEEATDSDMASVDGGSNRSPRTRMTVTTTTTTTGGSSPSTSRKQATNLIYDGERRELGTTSTTIQYSNVSAVNVDPRIEKDGTLHLHPVATRKDRKVKVKKVIQFVPRVSHFDRFSPTSQVDMFRGFYVLFWMLMGLAAIRTFYHSWADTGVVVGTRFAKLITGDGWVLAMSDAILVGVTILCVPFMKAIQYGWIRYHYTGLIMQHLAQTVFLATAIRWTFYREWYWVQSGFLTLHSLTMLMKVHSYCALNGALSVKAIDLKKARKQLDVAVEEKGGWSKVVYQASREDHHRIDSNGPNGTETTAGGSVAPTLDRRRSSNATEKISDESGLHQRRKTGSNPTRSYSQTVQEDREDPRDPKRLVDFSDEKIYNLANDCVDLQEELTSTGKEHITWPNNVTYANYIDYLLVPSLVYELEYPRTTAIRPLYVLEKTLATFGTFFFIYVITEHIIIPLHEANRGVPLRIDTFAVAALDFTLPFMLNYLLIFYIIFECICNAFAELTRFADRGFYEDWWNAVTWDEFARKWNKPVHQFLLRHVYASTIAAFRLSKFQASFLTFFLSACVHELVMAIVSKKFRMYLFIMQMLQLPMIAMGRLPILRKNPTAGNIFFWAGLIWGFPLLAVLYLRF